MTTGRSLQLSGVGRAKLVEALSRRYPDYGQFDYFLSVLVDRQLADFAAPGPLQPVVLAVVRAAEAQGWVVALVDAAAAESPNETVFQQLSSAAEAAGQRRTESPAVAQQRGWAVLDVRSHPEGPDVSGLREELRTLVTRAARAASLPDARVVPNRAPGRLVLGFPAGTSPQAITGRFLDELGALLGARNEARKTHDRLRLVVALHSAAPENSYGETIKVLSSPVLVRVLARAPGSTLVIAWTEAWNEKATPPAGICSHVRSGTDSFWICVPGTSTLPGLTPGDIAPPSGTAHGRRSLPAEMGLTGGLTIHGDYIAGDKFNGNKIVGGRTTIHHQSTGRRKDDG